MRPDALDSHLVYAPNKVSPFRIFDPTALVVRVVGITINGSGGQPLAAHALVLHHGFDLAAGIPRCPFVYDVPEWGKIRYLLSMIFLTSELKLFYERLKTPTA
jgi:hypothetical protein